LASTFDERAGAAIEVVRAAAALLEGASDVVVLWGERASHGERGSQTVDALLAVAAALGLSGRAESGLIEIPADANSRGLREVGVLPRLGPGLTDAPTAGMGAQEVPHAVNAGKLTTLLLLNSDPLETHPERAAWEQALERSDHVIAVAEFLSPGIEDHATVVFPAESNAEKDGTVTHPDGRVQRVRQAVGHREQVRPVWSVLADLAARAGAGLDVLTSAMVTSALTLDVPFYTGITIEEIGGSGVRWQDRGAALALPAAELPDAPLEAAPELRQGMRLGVAPSLWSGAVTRHAPSLKFLAPVQRAELSPADAERIGVGPGDEVEVSSGGHTLRATVALRQAVAPGNVFLTAGTERENPTSLMNGIPPMVEVVGTGRTTEAGTPAADAAPPARPDAVPPPS
ncbi:MAG: molybdopterin-dependent oxidoreductase, partial [Actinomycetota bacterium]|nr:molybdopterin-dependent oxidoreductase [Actinomycetota bacterium]